MKVEEPLSAMSLCTQPLLLLLLLFTTSLSHGEVFTAQQEDDVISFVEALRQCRDIVGVTVAVVRGNDTWTRGFGMADPDKGRGVSSTDLFSIGSVTKPFTSALLSLFLTEENGYTWDTPVSEIMGKDFSFVTEELTRQVTLKDILCHRTGLENINIPLFAGSNLTNAQFARKIRHLPVMKPFRDDFNYNNWLYGFLGNVAEKLGGAPWEELVSTHLLQPLNMTRTKAVMGKALADNDPHVAKPFVMLGGETVPSSPDTYRITPKDAAGSIASSAEDMAKWMRMLLNNGRTPDGRQVLSEDRLKEMRSPCIPISASRRARLDLVKPEFPIAYTTDSYGLGWNVANYRGYPMTCHAGSIWAYTTYLAIVPGLDLGVFVANNGPNGKSAVHLILQIFFYIADVVLGEEPWLNVSNACLYPQLWRPSSSSTDTPDTPSCDDFKFNNWQRYVGLYQHPLFEEVEVMKNGSQGLYVRYGLLEGQLCRTDAEDMALFEVVGKMAFVYRPSSTINYLQLNFNQPLSDGTYQEVVLNKYPSNSKALTFHRYPETPVSGCRGEVMKGFRTVVSLLVVTGVSLYLS